jgi:hypothetical protein
MTPPRLERFTFVLLRRPADAPDLPEAELDALQEGQQDPSVRAGRMAVDVSRWTQKGAVSFAR